MMVSVTQTTTKTIERPDVREDTSQDNDTPKFFHYVKKDQIVNSAVSGAMAVSYTHLTLPTNREV